MLDGPCDNYLRVTVDAEYLMIRLDAPADFRASPLVGKRHKMAKAAYRRLFEKLPAHAVRELASPLAIVLRSGSLARSLAKIDRRISALFDAAVSGTRVRNVLGISKEKQIRWLKDGRRPSRSRLPMGSKKSSFSVPVYAPDPVAMLEKNPAIVEPWRTKDCVDKQPEEPAGCD